MTATGQSQPRPVMIDNATARVMGSGALVKIRSADTADQLFAMEYDMPPRKLGTPHTHTYEDQVAYVLSGTLGYRVGDEEFTAPAGSTVFMPRGLTHVVFNPTDETARMLELTTPGRLFGLFEALQEIGAKGGDVEAAMQARREEYGFLLHPSWIAEMEQRHGLKWSR